MNKVSTAAPKKIIVAAFLLILTPLLFAQDCTTCRGSNTLSLTTGLDTSGNLMAMPSSATSGVPDPYWQLINVAPPSVNGNNTSTSGVTYTIAIPNAYTILSAPPPLPPPYAAAPASWLNIPGARALSVTQNHIFPTNNSVATQPWRFLRKFYLCQNASVHFVVDHTGDDYDILNIFDSNGALLHTETYNDWSRFGTFTGDLNMHAGCCYMTIELVNTGFVLTGFAVRANLSVTNNSLSNPNETCCATSVISGQKIIDTNCNGKYDAGIDLPGVSWVINLLSGSSVIQTVTTDANGEFTFYNVANGTYTLQEVSQSGYTPNNPSSGQYTVVVSAANSVQTFQFFNCKGSPVTPSPTLAPSPTLTPTPSGCAQVAGEARCLPDGSYSYTFTVTNNSGAPASQILLTPAQGSTFTLTPQLTNLSAALQNGQSTTVTTNITNVKPGDKVCFFASLISDKAPCCTVQLCPTLPKCGDVSPTPTVTSSLPPPTRKPSQGRRRS